jgi:hypothetical protein
MSERHCCHDSAAVVRRDGLLLSMGRRCLSMIEWAIPGALLAVMPKCPACVAAYVLAWTGLGLSFSVAKQLRTLLPILCVAWLLLLALRQARHFFPGRS